jgi:uncharacterized membrane protein
MELLMVHFDDEATARQGLQRLQGAIEDGVVEVGDFALVYKDSDGEIHVEQEHPRATGRGAVRGAVLGTALGLVTGGVGAVAAAGAAGGAAVGHRHQGIDGKVLKRIGQAIEGSEAAVFVGADVDTIDRIGDRIDEAHRDHVEYVVLTPEDEAALTAALE